MFKVNLREGVQETVSYEEKKWIRWNQQNHGHDCVRSNRTRKWASNWCSKHQRLLAFVDAGGGQHLDLSNRKKRINFCVKFYVINANLTHLHFLCTPSLPTYKIYIYWLKTKNFPHLKLQFHRKWRSEVTFSILMQNLQVLRSTKIF